MMLLVLGIVWGRVLNQLAYALIDDYAPITPTSRCVACSTPFSWYQRIPALSYIMMRGQCPHCHTTLSVLNPLTELLTGLALWGLYTSTACSYFPAYFIFFSALLVTLRTDMETMLISRRCTIDIIPLGLLLSALGLLPLSVFESMLGTVCGYLLLYGMMHIFFRTTGKHGMGKGDLDLLSCIGAFTGPAGCWVALLIGSTFGSLAGGILMLCTGTTKDARIPFGPFLALGAMAYVIWQQQLLAFLLGL